MQILDYNLNYHRPFLMRGRWSGGLFYAVAGEFEVEPATGQSEFVGHAGDVPIVA